MSLRNRILAALPDEELKRIRPSLEPVELEMRQVLMEPNKPMEHVYFPEQAVVSILGVVNDGSAVETATVGNEGMVGVPVYLGAMQMAAQALVQVPGGGHRMLSAALREEVRRGSPLAQVLGRYTQALLTLVSQSSACNRMHPVNERCARWLLMAHDRTGQDTFPLTQLFLAQMLGVRRTTVSEVASVLQAGELITYVRGEITVLDRKRLEAATCVCYTIIRNEFARMLDGANPPDPLDKVHISLNGQSTAKEPGGGNE